LKGSGGGQFEVISPYLRGGSEENHEEHHSAATADTRSGIQTEYFPNTLLERYRYASLLAGSVVIRSFGDVQCEQPSSRPLRVYFTNFLQRRRKPVKPQYRFDGSPSPRDLQIYFHTLAV
jgi:hypothetical protein